MFDLTTIQLMNEAVMNIHKRNRLNLFEPGQQREYIPERRAISAGYVRNSGDRLVVFCEDFDKHITPVKVLDAQGKQDVTLGSEIPVTSLK